MFLDILSLPENIGCSNHGSSRSMAGSIALSGKVQRDEEFK